MSWYRALFLILVTTDAWAAGNAFLLGGGVELDSDETLAGIVFGELQVSEFTWLSSSLAHTSVELPRRQAINTWYADVGVDHFFDPAGIRLSVAYWGDSNILDSIDGRATLYFSGPSGTIGIDGEYRDFEFELPEIDLRIPRKIPFHGKGFGMTARVNLSESVNIFGGGMIYDYNINLRLDNSRDIVNFLTVSRLSLINSLVDHRARLGLGYDRGLHRWQLEFETWQGAVDGGRTDAVSIRYMRPMTDRTDIEFSLGFDDSQLYGQVTIFSIFIYYYGGEPD